MTITPPYTLAGYYMTVYTSLYFSWILHVHRNLSPPSPRGQGQTDQPGCRWKLCPVCELLLSHVWPPRQGPQCLPGQRQQHPGKSRLDTNGDTGKRLAAGTVTDCRGIPHPGSHQCTGTVFYSFIRLKILSNFLIRMRLYTKVFFFWYMKDRICYKIC